MKIISRFRIGGTDYEINIEDKDDMDALHRSIILSNPPKYCNVCKNNKYFRLDSNKDKEANIYINVVCLAPECYAKAKLGRYKAGGYFWHKFEKYVKKTEEEPR